MPTPDEEPAVVDADPAGEQGQPLYARRPFMLAGVVGGVLLTLLATVAVVNVVNPDLVDLPPVMRRPAVAAKPEVSPVPVDPGEATSAAPSPGAPRTRRPTVPSASPLTAPTPSAVGTPPVLSLSPPAPATSPPFQSISYEAEASGNSVDGTAERVSMSGASGGRVVGYLGRMSSWESPGTLRFPRINVPTAGTYKLIVVYVSSGEDRTAVISVNGAAPQSVRFTRTSQLATKTVTVTLRAGDNSVHFGNSSGRCPAVDRIVISR